MEMKFNIYTLIAAVAISVLSACGGGGGGSVTAPTTPTVVTQDAACAVAKHNYGDITYPVSYKGTYTVPTPTQRLAPNIVRGMDIKDLYAGYGINGRLTDAGCTDSALFAKNAYVETLDRMKAVGSEQVWIYNFGVWDDFTKASFSIAPNTSHVPDAVFAFLVSEAKKRNMKVFYKWQFNDFDTKGNFYTNSPNAAQFAKLMDAYRRETIVQAALAEKLGIDGMAADPTIFLEGSGYEKTYKKEWLAAVTAAVSDIRGVYHGQVIYGHPKMLDEVLITKVDALVLNSWGFEIRANGITAFNLDVLKSHYRGGLAFDKQNYDIDTKGVRPDVPVIWDIGQKSAANFYAVGVGFIEDAVCVNNCIQLTYGTDFSLQALGIEAALEVINEQTSFKTTTVKFINGFWYTDSLTPTQYKDTQWGHIGITTQQWDFPNLADSIRNKPSEPIVKYWFGR